MLQTTSLKGKIEIAVHEGIAIERYLDTVGVWTIGIGVTKWANAEIDPETYKDKITVRHAIDMMESVLPYYEDLVRQLIGPQTIYQHKFDALVSAAYNLGPQFAAGTRTKILIRAGRYGDALMLWKKPRSIIRRRKKEAKLADHGIYSGGMIGVWAGGVNGDPHRMIYQISSDELADMMNPPLNFV